MHIFRFVASAALSCVASGASATLTTQSEPSPPSPGSAAEKARIETKVNGTSRHGDWVYEAVDSGDGRGLLHHAVTQGAQGDQFGIACLGRTPIVWTNLDPATYEGLGVKVAVVIDGAALMSKAWLAQQDGGGAYVFGRPADRLIGQIRGARESLVVAVSGTAGHFSVQGAAAAIEDVMAHCK